MPMSTSVNVDEPECIRKVLCAQKIAPGNRALDLRVGVGSFLVGMSYLNSLVDPDL
jgi:hypothetical protein